MTYILFTVFTSSPCLTSIMYTPGANDSPNLNDCSGCPLAANKFLPFTSITLTCTLSCLEAFMCRVKLLVEGLGDNEMLNEVLLDFIEFYAPFAKVEMGHLADVCPIMMGELY